jgi:hypothetical protein
MRKLNLMAAMGELVTDINTDARMLAVPEPHGRYHAPFPHMALVEAFNTEINVQGLHIVNRADALSSDGSRYFSMLELSNGSDYFSDVIALRSTHDQKFPITISSGSGVWVCSNLCIGGSEISKTKHTLNVMDRLPMFIRQALTNVVERNSTHDAIFKRLMATQIDEKTAMASMVYMLEKGIITANDIKRVLAEWREPSHVEFTEHGHSIWRLFNAVTEAYKPRTASGNSMAVLHARSPRLFEFVQTLANRY